MLVGRLGVAMTSDIGPLTLQYVIASISYHSYHIEYHNIAYHVILCHGIVHYSIIDPLIGPPSEIPPPRPPPRAGR